MWRFDHPFVESGLKPNSANIFLTGPKWLANHNRQVMSYHVLTIASACRQMMKSKDRLTTLPRKGWVVA